MRGRGEGSIRQRRRADGSVYWEARIRINGPQQSFYADTKSGAQAKARQARADAERGVAARRQEVEAAFGEPLTWERLVEAMIRFEKALGPQVAKLRV
jgi:hypothetical protein